MAPYPIPLTQSNHPSARIQSCCLSPSSPQCKHKVMVEHTWCVRQVWILTLFHRIIRRTTGYCVWKALGWSCSRFSVNNYCCCYCYVMTNVSRVILSQASWSPLTLCQVPLITPCLNFPWVWPQSSVKFLKENIREKLHGMNLGNDFVDMTWKA